VGAVTLRQATSEDLHALGLEAANDDAIGSLEALEAHAAAGPWRVQVTSEGDAVVFERWREHLGWLSMRAVWAAPARLPAIVGSARSLARAHGFDRLLSPLVPEEFAAPYLRSGMEVVTRLVVMRIEVAPGYAMRPSRTLAGGIVLADGGMDDLDDILALDQMCFDQLWAYDRRLLAGYIAAERLSVARFPDGALAGFTLSGIEHDQGSLGRLAVLPGARREGLGRALVEDAVRALAWQGVSRVTLTTQVENVAARALYASCGFRELRGHLVASALEA
jgi:ribosomal protein S18 acetylase RimI-like enzyme